VTGADDEETPLHQRAVAAATAELRGERTKILGATGQTSLQSLLRARRVPDRWSVPHHIAPDVDSERDLVTDDLKEAKVVTTVYEVEGIGPTLDGRNGGGDPYFTDGEIKISVLVEGCNQHSATVSELANPPLIDVKNDVWSVAARLLLPQSAAPPPNQ
jgi:LssY C-terminus